MSTTNHTTAAWNHSIQSSRGRLPMSKRLSQSRVLWDSVLATKCRGTSTESRKGPRMDMMRRFRRTNSFHSAELELGGNSHIRKQICKLEKAEV